LVRLALFSPIDPKKEALLESLSEQYSTKAAAAFRLPAEAGNGGDKAPLHQQAP
jgi:hypothetical protein